MEKRLRGVRRPLDILLGRVRSFGLPPFPTFFFQFTNDAHKPHPELRVTQMIPLHSQSSYARFGKVRSLGYAVLQKR